MWFLDKLGTFTRDPSPRPRLANLRIWDELLFLALFDWPTLLQEWKRTSINLTVQELVPSQLRHSGASIDHFEDVANGSRSQTMRRLEAGLLHDGYEKAVCLAQTCETYKSWPRSVESCEASHSPPACV